MPQCSSRSSSSGRSSLRSWRRSRTVAYSRKPASSGAARRCARLQPTVRPGRRADAAVSRTTRTCRTNPASRSASNTDASTGAVPRASSRRRPHAVEIPRPSDRARLKPPRDPADGRGAAMHLNNLLKRAVEMGASDVHLKVGRPPVFRHDGELAPIEDWPAIKETDLEAVLEVVCTGTPTRLEVFMRTGELDTAYTDEGLPRFRVNGFRQ